MASIQFQKSRGSELLEYEISDAEAWAFQRVYEHMQRMPEHGDATVIVKRGWRSGANSFVGDMKFPKGDRPLSIGTKGISAPDRGDDRVRTEEYQRLFREMLESRTVTIQVTPISRT